MTPTRLARVEAASRVTLNFYASLNRRDLPALAAALDPACVLEPPRGAPLTGSAAVITYWQNLLQTHPQYRVTLEETLSMGNRCVARWQDSTGTRGIALIELRGELIRAILLYVKQQD